MSQHIYSYEYRKPRLSNPTYLSNSVASTLAFYDMGKISSQIQLKAKISNQQSRNNVELKRPQMKPYKSDFSLPKLGRNQTNLDKSLQNVYTKRQNQRYIGQLGQRMLKQSDQVSNSMQMQSQSSQNVSSLNNILQRNKQRDQSLQTNGNLQNINTPFMNLNQKDIFMKQGHNYNIITYRPKEHNEHIKKYPKLTLEQKDQCFRLKYINDAKFKQNQDKMNPQSQEMSHSSSLIKNQRMAGMHTYRVDNTQKKLSQLKIQQNGNSNGKSHANNNNSKSTFQTAKDSPRSPRFDMKLLSSVDQFNYYE